MSALLLAFGAILASLIVVDRRGGRHFPFPWLWTLPSVLLIGLGVLTGAARYPGLPDELPSHFDIGGHADSFVPTTPFNAFYPVIIQVLVTAVIAASVALMLRFPYASALSPRRERSVALNAHAALILAASINFALFLVAQPIWLGRTSLPAGAMIGVALSLTAGLAAVGVATFTGGRGVPDADRRLFVPKHFGIGWTLNLGRPSGRILFVGLLAVPVLTAFLGHFAT